MKTVKKLIAFLVCICLIISVGVINFATATQDTSRLSAWIELAEKLLKEDKTYISGLTEFETALTAAKAGGDEQVLIQNLKSAWQGLWYTVRTQVSVPDTYSLNNSDEGFGTHYSTKSAAQPQFEWKISSSEEYWSNVVSFDFYVSGYITDSPNQNPNANSANLSLKFTNSDEYQYFGSTYGITKKGFSPTAKQFTIPASRFIDVMSQNGYNCELLVFKNASGEAASNTITVGSLFVTKKYQEQLPAEPSTVSVDSGSVRYGTSAVFYVPDGVNAYYTTDGTTPTVYSNKCVYGQEIAIVSDDLKILTVAEGFVDSVLDYTYDLVYVTRDEILNTLESTFGIKKESYSQMSDTELAASALLIEQGDVNNAVYGDFLNAANSFAASSVINITSENLRTLFKKSNLYSDLDIESYFDTEILNLIKSADTFLDTPLVQKEFEIVSKYVDSAVKVTLSENIANGTAEINGIFANTDDIVTIKLNPDSGYRTTAGTLVVYVDGKASVVPERCGFRNDTKNSNEFEFVMPQTKEIAVVAFGCEKADSSSPLGNIGRAKKENYVNGTDGLRFIYRCYLNDNIATYGIIITSKEDFDNSGSKVFDLNYSGNMTCVDRRDLGFMLYDQCDEYVDFSAAVIYDRSSSNKAKDIISCCYAILKDGTVYYSDLVCCSFNDLSNKCLSSDKLIYSDPMGANGKILSVASDNNAFKSEGKTELELEICDTTFNPYDDDEISLDMVLNSPDGLTYTVPGFYDDENTWKFRFSFTNGGFWKYNIVLKEQGTVSDTVSGYFEVGDADNNGYISVSKKNSSRFVFADGTSYIPFGMNVAWLSSSDSYIHYIDSIAAGGGNYMRMWLTEYGLTLFNNICEPDDYSLGINAAKELDKIIERAEEKGVYIQMALFNHELFQKSKSWCNNPFNSGNNGYINTPADFWTSAEALEDTKDYIRYLIARYGYSKALFSWEICNEITSCTGNDEEINNWSEKISQYIKSFGMYKQLVSSSCANSADDMLDADYLDFINLHIYNYISINDIKNKVSAWGNEKPVLISEIGVDYNSVSGIVDSDILRHNLWSGLMSGSAGGAASWYWNTIDSLKGYNVFGKAMDFAKKIPFEDGLTRINGTASQTNVKYMGYTGNNGLWLMVYDNNAVTTVNNTEPVYDTHTKTDISVAISNGTYTLEIYDTVNGAVIESKNITVENGTLNIALNNWSKDIAVAVNK